MNGVCTTRLATISSCLCTPARALPTSSPEGACAGFSDGLELVEAGVVELSR
jgi:hypothetical protein